MIDRRKQHADLAPGHQLDEFAFGDVARLDGGDLASIAEHGDAVADLLEFLDAVRHIDDADAGALEPADQREQVLRLGLGERGGRFIQNEQTHLGEERLGDLDHLLMGARQLADLLVGQDVEAEFADYRTRLGPHRRMIEEAAGAELPAQEEILLDRQLRHQAELLEHRTDPHHPRRVRREANEAASAKFELAGVGSESAGDDVDQGRFAGAVLAEQHMDLASPQVEIDIVQRQHAGEALGDSGHFQEKIPAGRLRGPRGLGQAALHHDDPADIGPDQTVTSPP